MCFERSGKELRSTVGYLMSVYSALAPGGSPWNQDPLPVLEQPLFDCLQVLVGYNTEEPHVNTDWFCFSHTLVLKSKHWESSQEISRFPFLLKTRSLAALSPHAHGLELLAPGALGRCLAPVPPSPACSKWHN